MKGIKVKGFGLNLHDRILISFNVLLEHAESLSFREFIQDSSQLTVGTTKSIDFMKNVVELRIVLESTFSGVTEDIRLNSFFMEVLASLTIRTIGTLMILFARLGLVLDMS